MPKTRAKTKAGKRRAIHREAQKLKRKKSHRHLTQQEAHGVATRIVTGKGPKRKSRRKSRKR